MTSWSEQSAYPDTPIRSYMENCQDAVVLLDSSGSILYKNPAYWSKYDQPERESVSAVEPVYNESREFTRNFRIVTSTGTSLKPFLLQRSNPDGTMSMLSIAITPVSGLNHETIYAVVERDVSELVRSGREESGDNQRDIDFGYERLMKYVPDPIFVHDGMNIIYLNKAALRLLGTDHKEEVIGRSLVRFIHPGHREVFQRHVKSAFLKDESVDFFGTKVIRLDSSKVDVDISSVRIYNYMGENMVIQSVIRDTTERKKAEEALIKSEKLSIVGQLAAGVAHEIRNPLTALRGFSQLLRTKVHQYQDYFDIMLGELDRINQIVKEFMTLAKPQENHFEEKELVEIIENVVTLLGTEATLNNVEIQTRVETDLHRIYADENQLKQVLVNLLKNSIESMPSGGIVEIVVKAAADEAVAVQITDQGEGIPPEQLQRLGEPFYSTKSNGTGLGLMVCFRIIQNHNGTLSFASKVGEGTSVTITLPVSP